MAKKAKLDLENLKKLGLEKLATIILEETAHNAPFRKLANAALASQDGPEAVAKMIDKRLSALERARSFIDYEKVREFSKDLQASIIGTSVELGKTAPSMAIDRLFRFIEGSDDVINRVDDSSGRIGTIYDSACAMIGEFASKLSADDRIKLSERIIASQSAFESDFFDELLAGLAPQLEQQALRALDDQLAIRLKAIQQSKAKADGWLLTMRTYSLHKARDIIAEALGDLDHMIALEESKELPDTMLMATRLFAAGRFVEALDWVRRKGSRPIPIVTRADIANNRVAPAPGMARKAALEASILDALGRGAEAQEQRWAAFEATLNSEILRAYIGKLPDFDEFAELDKAFAYVMGHAQIYSALAFLLNWPKLDIAAKLVLKHARKWDGGSYAVLSPAADALDETHPAASTILRRKMLDDILRDGRSSAYPAGARHWSRLNAIGAHAADELQDLGFERPEVYAARVTKDHARKISFWDQIAKLKA